MAEDFESSAALGAPSPGTAARVDGAPNGVGDDIEWNTVGHHCGCESYNGAGMDSWRWRPKSHCPDHERLVALIAAKDWPEVDRLLAVIRGG